MLVSRDLGEKGRGEGCAHSIGVSETPVMYRQTVGYGIGGRGRVSSRWRFGLVLKSGPGQTLFRSFFRLQMATIVAVVRCGAHADGGCN